MVVVARKQGAGTVVSIHVDSHHHDAKASEHGTHAQYYERATRHDV